MYLLFLIKLFLFIEIAKLFQFMCCSRNFILVRKLEKVKYLDLKPYKFFKIYKLIMIYKIKL